MGYSYKTYNAEVRIFEDYLLIKADGKQLSDKTRIAGTTWGKLKESAMKPDYQQQNWFFKLEADGIELLERLIEAQRVQGDMVEIKEQPDKADDHQKLFTSYQNYDPEQQRLLFSYPVRYEVDKNRRTKKFINDDEVAIGHRKTTQTTCEDGDESCDIGIQQKNPRMEEL